MKITIITLYNAFNYGAYLQAYALGKIFEDKGHIVTYYSPIKHRLIDFVHMLHLRETRFIKFRADFMKNYFCAMNSELRTSTRLPVADLTIIGSDEVWNIDNDTFFHSDIFIGKGITNSLVATYAVSAGNCSIQSFKKTYGKDAFSNLDFISVRDQQTMALVNSLTDKTTIECLDPTYLFNFSPDVKNVKLRDYILVYGYKFSESEIRRIRELKESTSFTIAAIGFPQEWADVNLSVGPMEFVDYVGGAECVVTSTFHGTAFSIMLNKQFVVFDRSLNKVRDVLEKVELQNRLVVDCELYPIIHNAIDYKSVIGKLSPYKEKSLNYINNLVVTAD